MRNMMDRALHYMERDPSRSYTREIRNQRGPTWLLDHCKPRDLEPPTP